MKIDDQESCEYRFSLISIEFVRFHWFSFKGSSTGTFKPTPPLFCPAGFENGRPQAVQKEKKHCISWLQNPGTKAYVVVIFCDIFGKVITQSNKD